MAWGSTQAMWERTIWPRIKNHFPVRSVLEIACGMGRCSRYLIPHCDKFVGIDVVDKCVESCRVKMPSGKFVVTDGLTIPVESDSIDFVFSWDSLVHCDMVTVLAYLKEIKRVLSPEGSAFIHHSNWGSREGDNKASGWRAKGVSAQDVSFQAAACGLDVDAQEVVSWGEHLWSDAFTTLSKSDKYGKSVTPVMNNGFGQEVSGARFLEELYASVAQR